MTGSESRVRILAIRLARLGDIILLLPALTLLKAYIPGSRITFLTDHRHAPLAELCPAIDEIIPVDRIAMRDGSRWDSIKSMRQVITDVRSRRFDLAIDFHGFRETNLLTWLSGARKRLGLKRSGESFLNFCFNMPPVAEDKTIHVGEMFLKVVQPFRSEDRLQSASASLVVPETARQWAKANLPQRPFAALYLDAPTAKRIWLPERFAAVADYLAGQLGMDVVALSGPDGAPLLNRFQTASEFPIHVRGFSNLTIPQLAATVESAALWLSNDTGPLHLGPILGVPTLGLFSIGEPANFRPAGIHDRFIQADPIDGITVSQVIAQIVEMRSTGHPDLRR